MPAPTGKTNNEMVLDCIEYRLKQITHANNCYNDGIVVDRAKDPTLARQNKIAEYKQKNVLVTMHLRDASRDPGASLGGIKRNKQIFHLNCLIHLTPAQREAGLDVDRARERLRWDIVWKAFDADHTLHAAAAALGLDKPSCVNLQVDDVVQGPQFAFPETTMILTCSYLYDERRPTA